MFLFLSPGFDICWKYAHFSKGLEILPIYQYFCRPDRIILSRLKKEKYGKIKNNFV